MTALQEVVLGFILGGLIFISVIIVVGCCVAFVTFMTCNAVASAFDNYRRISGRKARP